MTRDLKLDFLAQLNVFYGFHCVSTHPFHETQRLTSESFDVRKGWGGKAIMNFCIKCFFALCYYT